MKNVSRKYRCREVWDQGPVPTEDLVLCLLFDFCHDDVIAVTSVACLLSPTAPPAVRIVHAGQACNVEEERYSERVFTIREGGTLELQCLVTGHPRPQVPVLWELWELWELCCILFLFLLTTQAETCMMSSGLLSL